MGSLLKDIYSPAFVENLVHALNEVVPGFDRAAFRKQVFHPAWPNLELKARMQHLADSMHTFMPDDFTTAAPLVSALLDVFRKNRYLGVGIEYMFIPEYIHRYGLDHLEISCQLMEQVTQFTSCEFAVRPFIIRYEKQMVRQLITWSLHASERVRRLASEGSRPRLPWAIAIPAFKKDPTPILPILENLRCDPSETVRRSVANNLNDIAKDNPEVVVKIVRSWRSATRETDSLLRHASRTLLKRGHPEILKLYGLAPSDTLDVSAFRITDRNVAIGDKVVFSFAVTNKGSRSRTVRIEYFVHHLKKNGSTTKKIFKISERSLGPGERIQLNRSHPFKPITTRVFYPGTHAISIVINGREYSRKTFELHP